MCRRTIFGQKEGGNCQLPLRYDCIYIFLQKKFLKQGNVNTGLFENKYPVTQGFFEHFAHNYSGTNVKYVEIDKVPLTKTE